MPFSSRAAIALTGLSLSLGAAPSLAADLNNGWAAYAPVAAAAASQAEQVSILPPLPTAPRVFAITPERRALLNTIRYAEGTWKNGDTIGYRVMFGGGLTNSLDRHPNRVIYSSGYASAAAGAYQFMPFTWSMASRLLGLQKFSPEEQDQAALLLIQRRGALSLADEGRFTPSLAARLAPEWASFPTLVGSSYYGQPVRRFSELKRFYEDNLAQLLGEPSRDNANGSLAGPTTCDQGQLVCRSIDSTGPSF